MPIQRTAEYRVRPEHLDTCLSAVRTFVADVRANEPTTRSYVAWQDEHDSVHFLHFFVFDDADAEERHRRARWTEQFTATLYPALAGGPVQFSKFVVVA